MAYLDDWPVRQRIWPWTTALVGLAVSIAGNVGHIQARPGEQVLLADRLTAATSPVAAFAGLTVGLLVLKMTRERRSSRAEEPRAAAALVLAPPPMPCEVAAGAGTSSGPPADVHWADEIAVGRSGAEPRPGLLCDARAIFQQAASRGERLSQRTLARQLRNHGHRFPNEHLRGIADSIGLTAARAA